jgi:hypothetical protein
MRARLPLLVLTGGLALAGAHALAQAEAERQLDLAIERLKEALGPDTQLTFGRREVDPVSGRARLTDVVLRESDSRMTIAEVLLQELSERRVGRAEARDARLVLDKGDRFELGRIVVAGLPLPPRGQRPEWQTFELGELEAERFRAVDGDARSMGFERLSLAGYQPGALARVALEGASFQETTGDRVRMQVARLAGEGLRLPLPDMAPDPRAFAASRVALEDFRMAGAKPELEMGVARIALQDWVPGRLTSLAVEGIAVTTEFGPMGRGQVRIARMAASGLDAAGVVAAHMEGKQPPDPVPGTPQRIAIEDIAVTAGNQSLFSLARIAIDAAMAAPDAAVTGGLVIEGLRAALHDEIRQPLEELGYREIAGGAEIRAEALRAGGRVAIQPFRIGWDQAGALALAARFDRLPLPPPGATLDPQAQLAEYAAARLIGLTLSWEEAGLFERALAMLARQQRTTPEKLREQWVQMALQMPVPGDAPPPRGQRGRPAPQAKDAGADAFAPLRQAVAAFIRNPRRLEITLAPPAPVAFADMAAFAGTPPAELVRRLGFSARAN